jgi:pyruvate/2-oxoglutarate dehydrogenase complex dihydrolipoamide dehydrogenase (E3) component
MTQPAHYEAIIIGSGQGGTPLAEAFAQAGRRTALVEREHVGGTCVNVGCTPSKTMVASARVAFLSRRAADYGVRTGPVSLDLAAVRQRKRNIVDEWRDGQQGRLERTEHLDLLLGEARFTGPKSIEVALQGGGRRRLTADLVFINTGERPAVPSIPGLDAVPTLNSTSIMELDTVPEHLLVLGGGYVGLEFGQMFRRFGSRVTIVERGPQVLGHEDLDVAEAVAGILKEDGIEVLLNAEARRVEPGIGGEIRLDTRAGVEERVLSGSHLLIATGRVPNTDRLNLAASGIETDPHGYVKVNERLESSVPGVYALGDVKGGPAFTHISYDDFRILYANLFEGGHAITAGRLVPYTVFIDPQLGRVGLSERQAQSQGRAIKVARMPMADAARAEEIGETRGFMKAVADAATGQILGCAILGIEGGEIMSMLQIAMLGKLPFPVLREAIFAHPTLAESLNNLFYTIT